MKNNFRKQLSLFITCCFATTFFIDLVIYKNGGLAKFNLVPFQMLVPALAAILVLWITKDKPVLKSLGFRFFKMKHLLAGSGVIVLCVLLSYVVSSLFIKDLFIGPKELNAHLLRSGIPFKTGSVLFNMSILVGINILIGPVVNLPIFLGEEVGWRAFMMPRLLQYNKKYAFIIGGIVWSLWHGPIIAMGHNYPAYPFLGNLLFILFCIPTGYIFYYFFKKSGSVFIPALMHGVLNKAAMIMVVYCVDEKKIHPLYHGAAGITGVVAFSIVALVLWKIDKSNSGTDRDNKESLK